MKIGLIALPLLCVFGMATADGMESAGKANQAATAAAPQRTQARTRMAGQRAKRLPHGDLRYCLDLKTEEAIIRCAETRRKR